MSAWRPSKPAPTMSRSMPSRSRCLHPLECLRRRGHLDRLVDAKSVEVTTPPQAFERVKAALEALGVTVENAEITMQPKQTVPIGEDKAVGVLRLMESLEEDDDVQQVYANFDI